MCVHVCEYAQVCMWRPDVNTTCSSSGAIHTFQDSVRLGKASGMSLRVRVMNKCLLAFYVGSGD